jgi:hypothetical protein
MMQGQKTIKLKLGLGVSWIRGFCNEETMPKTY